MAHHLSSLTRASLRSTSSTSTSTLLASFLLQTDNSFNYTTTTPQQPKQEGWLTLPPFSSTINATEVAKRLSRPATTTTAASSNTALKWVLRCCPQLSHSLVQKLFRLRQVRKELNPQEKSLELGNKSRLKRVSAKDELSVGDRIFLPLSVQEKHEIEQSEKHKFHYSEDEISYIQSLELHKDPAIIVINKPPGMPVQGGIGIKNSLDVLAAVSLKYDFKEPPRLVHRLDRDSSGILVLGRTQTSATVLHSIFREKTFGASSSDAENTKRILQRTYWALVIGTPRRTSGLISAPLGKVVLDDGKSEQITIVDDAQTMSCQHAVTEYRVIETSHHGFTWLELRPLTGRKHQLRVHCAQVLGTPIVGDYKYGWQVHRKWKPMPWSNSVGSEKLAEINILPFGLNSQSGSILEKRPHLHLHCKRMVLPDVSLALDYMQSSEYHDLSQLQSLNLVAPLPSHMQRSWDILKS